MIEHKWEPSIRLRKLAERRHVQIERSDTFESMPLQKALWMFHHLFPRSYPYLNLALRPENCRQYAGRLTTCLKDMTSKEFLSELSKLHGGKIADVYGVGPKYIVELRRALDVQEL